MGRLSGGIECEKSVLLTVAHAPGEACHQVFKAVRPAKRPRLPACMLLQSLDGRHRSMWRRGWVAGLKTPTSVLNLSSADQRTSRRKVSYAVTQQLHQPEAFETKGGRQRAYGCRVSVHPSVYPRTSDSGTHAVYRRSALGCISIVSLPRLIIVPPPGTTQTAA